MFHHRRPSFIQRPQPTRVSVARTGSRLGQLSSLASIVTGCSLGLAIFDPRGTIIRSQSVDE
jgi:hypothetical protein